MYFDAVMSSNCSKPMLVFLSSVFAIKYGELNAQNMGIHHELIKGRDLASQRMAGFFGGFDVKVKGFTEFFGKYAV
jgi:hypothetical protein